MEKKYSPMIMQYLDIKKDYPEVILFYRVGDFYELFFDDAKIGAVELELVLTGKDAGVEERAPMCGVPYHAVKGYIEKLVQKGYKVAICEQMEEPGQNKIVKRDVVQIVTPGALIDVGLEENKNNYVVAVDDYADFFVIAFADMSTGETGIINCEHDFARLVSELDALEVKEIVINSYFDKTIIKDLKDKRRMIFSYQEDVEDNLEFEDKCYQIKDVRQVRTFKRLLAYLNFTQKRDLDYIKSARVLVNSTYLQMDNFTRTNLELTRTVRSSDRYGSLLWLLDKTKTAMGARMLKNWIVKPLADLRSINERLNLVESFTKRYIERKEIEECLKEVYDLERLVARISYGSANAKDLLQLKKSLKAIPNIKQKLIDTNETSFINIARKINEMPHIVELLEKAIVEDPPLSTKEGGMIKEGYSVLLDEIKSASKNGKEWISNMENAERERTGIKTLKVGFNKVFGYYIEITKSYLDQVKEEFGYERKQTLVGAERFITQELKEKEELILNAEDKIIKLEYELLVEIREKVKKETTTIQMLANSISLIDCVRGLAEVAVTNRYVRPTFNENGIVDIKEGRHPVIEKIMVSKGYVSNDVNMNNEKSLLLITGPNMGGKSTYMRQVAIIVIMAQIGSFVPASFASLPVFDKIFTRIGASDDLISGQSTFMVEMLEANNAIRNATESSLIIFDEIGRGTSTYDGMALAQAIVEHLSLKVKAKTLFSTHYHELTRISEKLPNIENVHVKVYEEDDKVTFLYKIASGCANKSYGINVARLAHLPNDLIDRAKEVLEGLETNKVFNSKVEYVVKENVSLPNWVEDVKNVDPLNMSPLDALNFLYDLKKKIK